jgi:hypothetical protein
VDKVDKFEEYILDKIEDYRTESKRESDTKADNELLIGELINALVQYRSLGGSIK